ncbi:Isochorismatase domain-containing protein 1 [Escovopsis weberi]|uniref:Isochorismatase domain-containing protein 1 n=1 Tax=Escovopsis weberi TaxID=150374 RepID=A0A0M8N175_ESCWE|nr:Isochorismatase domain-containing protein 1 [Escovopsis weberi]
MATKLRFRVLAHPQGILQSFYGASNYGHPTPPKARSVCDLQERFRPAIYEFDSIVSTTKKLIAFANTLNIPIHATTQTSAKLGPIIPSLAELLPAPHDKTKFSMYIPPIASQLGPKSRIAVVGIESHICITQTALDLRDAGHIPYIIADAVSSCNRAEVIIALDRLRAEPGIIVTTSESWMYECVGDASHPAFKGLINVVKNSIPETRRVWDLLLPTSKM